MKRLIAAAAFGLVLSVVPLPKFEFLPRAVTEVVPLPEVQDAGADELTEVQAAADEPLGTDRVQAAEESTPGFTVIGLTFDTPPDQPVLVRVKDDDGNFGPWQELHAETAEGPDAGSPESDGRTGTEPFWVGDGTGYEVNLGADDAPEADVVLVHEEQQRTIAEATPVAEAANPLGIRGRGEWGARPPAGDIGMGSTNKLAVVHHSDSPNSYSPDQVPGILRGVQAYHIDGRGWSDIGYNFVVDKYGTMWEARAGSLDSPVVGAHAGGFNTNTVGIMVLGDYIAAQPSAAALEGVSQIVGWRLGTYGVDPAGSATFTSGGNEKFAAGTPVNLPNVVGHQDTGSTSCPGSIENYLPQIRARAQDVSQQYRGEVNNLGTVSPFGGGFFVQGTARDASQNPNGPVTLELDGTIVGTYTPQPSGAYTAGFVGITGGDHQLCMMVRRRSDGVDAKVDCRNVNVPGSPPWGTIDAVRQNGGRVYFAGWAYDPETTRSIDVHITVDGKRAYRADSGLLRPDVGGYLLPGYGPLHGYEYEVALDKGSHTVCAVAINVGQGSNTYLGCRNVVVK